ncbi:retrovirus-related pol polyprotein from transposon TNT 1-94 [Tanacetum coccineum]
MANLSEDIQCAGSDTRPPMLDRTDFASWQQRIRLYCRGKENGVNILKSIDEGPFQMGTFRETLAEGNQGALQLGPERARVYSDLSPEDKDRYNADIRATNILLQGLPKDIYSLINHYTDAKDIWDNVKMLLEGSELTKEDRESQLYDDFEHFRQNKGETIHDYYVRFAKLINDMRNIKMTMSRMQLNSKFVNNMLPEWGRFVTAVKLNRGLRDSNYDQLYAYLKQHEAHANENKMMLDRFTQHTVDPLALMSNVSHQQTSSNTRNQATVQDGRVVIQNVQGRQNRGQGNNARGVGAASYGGAQNRIVDEQPVQDLALNVDNVFQDDDCDAFDFDVDVAPTTQTMFMANLSSADPVYDKASPSYVSDTLLSKVHDHDHYQDAVCEYHEVHEMHADYTSDSNMIPYDQYVKDNAVTIVQSNVSSVPNDSYMMILNGIYKPSAQCGSVPTQNNVVDNSLTAELATYKEQVELGKRSVLAEYFDRAQQLGGRNVYIRDLIDLEDIFYFLVKDTSASSRSKPRSNTKKDYLCPEDTCKQSAEESRTDRLVVFGLRLFKTYDRGSLTAQEFREKSSSGQLDSGMTILVLSWVMKITEIGGSNLYTVSVEDMMKSFHICLPRLKFEKDHLYSAWQLGKSKKHTHTPKTENTNLEVLNTLHMDLCGPMKVQTINEKKYILVIVDDYSRFTWVKFLRSKDKTPEFVIKFLKQIQVGLNQTVRYIRTDNGIKFVNQVLTTYYESVGIFHQKLVPRTLQQNDVVERQNCTLVEAARTMLIFSNALMFLWAEVVATAWLIPNSVPTVPYVPPTNKELEILFQPMFDEYLEPPRVERPVSPAPAVLVLVNSAGTPSSTTIDQDAPSLSHSPSSSALQSPSSHQGVTAGSTIIEDNPFAHAVNDPFINVFAPKPCSVASSSGDVSLA